MALDDEDERKDAAKLAGALEGGVIDALEDVALKDPDDDDGPRDSFMGRWSKFLVIMVFLGAITAGLAAFWTLGYSGVFGTGRRHEMEMLTQKQWEVREKVLKHDLERNSIFGFAVGASIGGIYVLKCLIRGVDP